MAIGEWGEGASTVVLFSLAQLLEARSLERARRAISGLLSLAPETALVRRKGGEERVAAADVARGEHIFVRPGERVPLDGLVVAGASDVDQSPLTGESRPVPRGEGDGVFAGSINGAGALEVRVTRPSGETTLARVLRRVEEAQSSRAPSQGFVEALRPRVHAGGGRAGRPARGGAAARSASGPSRSGPTARSCCSSSPARARSSSPRRCRSCPRSPRPRGAGSSSRAARTWRRSAACARSSSTRRGRSPAGGPGHRRDRARAGGRGRGA